MLLAAAALRRLGWGGPSPAGAAAGSCFTSGGGGSSTAAALRLPRAAFSVIPLLAAAANATLDSSPGSVFGAPALAAVAARLRVAMPASATSTAAVKSPPTGRSAAARAGLVTASRRNDSVPASLYDESKSHRPLSRARNDGMCGAKRTALSIATQKPGGDACRLRHAGCPHLFAV